MKLTEEHEAVRRTIRRFIEEEINPHVAEWEEAEIFRRTRSSGSWVISACSG